MNYTKDEIIAAAKALPDEERWEVIEELQATMPEAPVATLTPEMRAEFDRRWGEYKSGKVKGMTLDEVLTMAQRTANGNG